VAMASELRPCAFRPTKVANRRIFRAAKSNNPGHLNPQQHAELKQSGTTADSSGMQSECVVRQHMAEH